MKLLQETLKSIKPGYREAMDKAKERLDSLSKPAGSLGILEEIAIKMAGITGNVYNEIKKRNIIVMCADNGVVDEGVSSAPQFITAVLTENLNKGATGVSALSKFYGADVTTVDIGVKAKFNSPYIIDKKIAMGTKNIAIGPAMEYDEAVRAIESGIEIADESAKKGYNILGTGEMGIGNTTTSAALLSVLSGLDVETVSGKGAGLTEEQFKNKIKVIKRAIEINKPKKDDPIDVISKVGGFDIAGMCGCFLSAAKNRVPIVIDGFISSAAALCAVRMNPNVADYIFPSHLSAEPGAMYMMKEIGIEPILNLKMRLGEGSGCPLAFMIIDSALYIIKNMATFNEASINNSFIIDIRK